MAQITAKMVKELREISGVGMMDCKKALTESDGDFDAAKELLRKRGQAKALKKSSRETTEGSIGYFVADDSKSGALVKVACETDFVAKNENFQKVLAQLATQANSNGSDGFLEQSLVDGEGTVQDLFHKSIGELGENIQFLDAKKSSVETGVVGSYIHTTGKVGTLVALSTDKDYAGSELNDLAKDIAMHVAATPAEAIDESGIDPDVLEKEKKVLVAQAKESGKPDNIIEKMIVGRMNKFKKEICILSQPFVKNPDKTISALLEDASKATGVSVTMTDFAKFQF